MLKVNAKNLETVTVLSLQGRIVTGDTDILRDAVTSLEGMSTVVLDLARVSTIDAHGLGVLLELRERSLANGIRFKLMNVSKPMSQVFEITHLNSVFDISSGYDFIPKKACDPRVQVAA